MDKLTGSANSDLDAGASLDPGLQQLSQQATRQGQAARGLGYGPGDAMQESMAMTQFGNQLRQQRQQNAMGVGDWATRLFTAPAMSLLQSTGPTIIPGGQNYDVFNTAYNAQASADIANQNARVAMLNGFQSAD
jgi:hypothetical protein